MKPTRDPRHDILFEPVVIGPKTLPNRFYAVPHSSGMGTIKPLSQAAFRGTKAEGGWGAVCTEYSPVSADADESPSASARVWDDHDVEALRVMCESVHSHGSLAGIELTHTGGHAMRAETRWPAIAPSTFPSAWDTLSVAKGMEKSDILRVQKDFRDAALRSRDAGVDIVCVYGGTDLTLQFLSPFFNARDDEYGGPLENRARFWLEIMEQLKQTVGDDCAISLRLSMDALRFRDVPLEEALAFVEMADPFVDLWDVNLGEHTDYGASRFTEEGYQFEWTSAIRQATAKPVVGVGRLTNPDRMAEYVRSGVIDLVGAARPSIADPYLPAKIRDGRYGDIRECIGCNVCILKAESSGHIACTQNATAGEEHRRGWNPESFTTSTKAERAVLVVGGGPAGMECAIVLGRRGHDVHLVEKSDDVGGHMRWTSSMPGFGQWARTIDWRKAQLDALPNVEVILNTELDAEAVRTYGADLVVVATGSAWRGDGLTAATGRPIDGADDSLPHVLTPEQVVRDGKRPPGSRVIVYDVQGYVVGAGVAELLASQGYAVTIMTPDSQVAAVSDRTLEGPFARMRLNELGVVFERNLSLHGISSTAVQVVDEFGGAREIETDAVVVITARAPEEAMYLELASDEDLLESEGVRGLYRVGDCLAPVLTADAIFSGHRLGREIDSDDPSVPLPYRQDHRLRILPLVGTSP